MPRHLLSVPGTSGSHSKSASEGRGGKRPPCAPRPLPSALRPPASAPRPGPGRTAAPTVPVTTKRNPRGARASADAGPRTCCAWRRQKMPTTPRLSHAERRRGAPPPAPPDAAARLAPPRPHARHPLAAGVFGLVSGGGGLGNVLSLGSVGRAGGPPPALLFNPPKADSSGPRHLPAPPWLDAPQGKQPPGRGPLAEGPTGVRR